MMIILFNTNTYIGGGEVIFSSFAKWLKKNNTHFSLFCSDDSFIKHDANENNLNFEVISVNQRYHDIIKSSVRFRKDHTDAIYYVVANLRDFYTLISSLRNEKITEVKVLYLMYHPDDVSYLSVWSLCFSKWIKAINLKNYEILAHSSALVFPSLPRNQVAKITQNPTIIGLPGKEILQIKKQKIDTDFIRIAAVCRFVHFKTGSLISLLKTLKQFPNIQLDIFGYGRTEVILKFWIYIYGLETRVKLVGKVDHKDLSQLLSSYDILYAQGTTLLECISVGRPTIIQNYSGILDMLFPKTMCGGIVGDTEFHLGENKNYLEYDFPNCLNKVINDIEKFTKLSLEEANNHKPNLVFGKLKSHLSRIKPIKTDQIVIPPVPIAKKIVFK